MRVWVERGEAVIRRSSGKAVPWYGKMMSTTPRSAQRKEEYSHQLPIANYLQLNTAYELGRFVITVYLIFFVSLC
jgi:hypothetical protein